MKNLYVRATTLYVTLFLFAGTVAQAATSRSLDPSALPWLQVVKRTYLLYRSAFDVLKFPVG